MNTYSQIGDDLLVLNPAGVELWRGKPEGFGVKVAFAVPGSEDGLVLYEPYPADWQKKQWQRFQNLVRVRSDGSVVWRAELPQDETRYLGASLSGSEIRAAAPSYDVTLDLETGKIRAKTWTK